MYSTYSVIKKEVCTQNSARALSWYTPFRPQGGLDPCSTAVPFWGRITQTPSDLSPKRDCGTHYKGVKERPPVVGTKPSKF